MYSLVCLKKSTLRTRYNVLPSLQLHDLSDHQLIQKMGEYQIDF